MSVIIRRPQPALASSTSAGSSSPLASFVKKSTPTARTSGSANGSSISGSSSLVAIALAAATMVAVAPTLEARSHVSSSVRAMSKSFRQHHLLSLFNQLMPTVHLDRNVGSAAFDPWGERVKFVLGVATALCVVACHRYWMGATYLVLSVVGVT